MKSIPLFLAAGLGWSALAAEPAALSGDLITRLASPTVSARYSAQMELQAEAAQASRPGAGDERAAFSRELAAKVVDETVPQPARVWIVRQLEYMGAAEAVDALAKLLQASDAELRECARRALEKNPSSEAGASLRSALEHGGDPAWEAGLINSLGQRRDDQAVDLVAARLEQRATATAAAEALGSIASSPAIAKLWAYSAEPAVADALLAAARNLLARNQAASAKELFAKLYDSEVALPARAAALYGMAQADYPGALPALVEALKGSDPKLRQSAVAALAAFSDSAVMGTLAPLWPSLSTDVKVTLVSSLKGMTERMALESLESKDDSLRMAAIDALARVGGAGSVPVLVRLATGQGAEKAAATSALVRMAKPEALAALTDLANNGETKSRVAALTALAARRDPETTPHLFAFAQEPNPDIQTAAFTALGQYGGDAELEPLAKLARQTPNAERLEAVESVCSRVKDKEAAVVTLLKTLDLAPEPEVVRFANAFSLLGGQRGARLVSSMAVSEDPKAAEIALRALANWPDLAAADSLLKLAENANTPQLHYVLVMQGIARLARSAETEPAEARAALVEKALGAARRIDEKKVLLAALGDVPHAKSVQLVRGLLADPELKSDAASAGVTLAGNLIRTDRRLAREMAQAVRDANVSQDTVRRAQRFLR